MLMVYLFGILDLATALSLVLVKYFPLFRIPLIILSGLILLKSMMYIRDFASIVDILAVVLIAVALLGYYPMIVYAAAIWLVQKGLRSLI